jgi:molecular chaperone GrpE
MAVRGIRVPLATRVPLQPIPASHALPYAFPRRFLSSSDKSSSSEQGSPTTDPADGGEDLGKGTETAIADKLQSELKKVEEELQDMKDKMLRAFADAENARVIARKDVESARTYAITKFAKVRARESHCGRSIISWSQCPQGMLEVADNLSRAIESVPREQQPQTEENKQLLALLQGVELTNAQLEKVFGENGLLKVQNQISITSFLLTDICSSVMSETSSIPYCTTHCLSLQTQIKSRGL